MQNKLEALTSADIKEIAAIEEVRECWGAESEAEMADLLRDDICAVKFPDYITDGPGYAGPLFILMGGALDNPLLLIRQNGQLRVVH
jgi:hypothetical protein